VPGLSATGTGITYPGGVGYVSTLQGENRNSQYQSAASPELAKEAEEILSKIPGYKGPLATRPEIRTLKMSEIPEQRIDWLIQPWIPLGMVTATHGDPGVGKSAMLTDIAARVSTGAEMPNGAQADAASVLILIGDDDLGKTVRPRLRAAGADLDRVTVMLDRADYDEDGFHTGTKPISLIRDLDLIRHRLIEIDAKLLLVDPLLAFFGAERDTNSVSDVAEAMYKIKLLAEETNCAVVVNTWNSKASTGKALARLMGSQGFSGVVRAAFLVDEHPEDPGLLVFACSKMNIAAKPVSQTFRVESRMLPSEKLGKIETAAIVWEGATEMSAQDLGAVKVGSVVADAQAWLRQRLADGPVLYSALLAEGKSEGISRNALTRARDAGGVKVHTTSTFPKQTEWSLQ